MTKLNVDVGGLELKNPVLLASGTAGYGTEYSAVTDLSRLGGVVLKSVTVEPRGGNPAPRIWETASGVLNSIGLENVGIDALINDILPALAGSGITPVASIAGETVKEYARMASMLDGSGMVSAIEVNVSCPNVERGGILFGTDAGATSAVVMAVRENTSLPVFAKLSAMVSDVVKIAYAAMESGANGLSLINTVPGMAVDHLKRRANLGAVTGGLSGPAIKPIALKAVWDCYRSTGMPIIGCGGIFDATDVLEFMVVGATAVAIGSVNFKDPSRALRIVEELPSVMAEAGADSPGELVGTLKVKKR